MKFLKLLLLVFSISPVFSQNSLLVKDIGAGPGDTAKITIALKNTDEVSGFQFTLKVPPSLKLQEKEVRFAGRNSNHIIYPKNNGNGSYLFVCFSATNANFSGTAGDLIEIPIEIPLSYIVGTTYPLELNEVILSSSTGTDIGSNHQNGLLTILEGKNPDLVIKNINLGASEIVPGKTFALDWEVHNIGKSTALGGWREQLYLSDNSSQKEYLISNESYIGNVTENQHINRTTTLTIPKTLGFDDSVKIKIILVPAASVKETEALKINNTTLSDQNATLLKKLTFDIDKTAVIKNSGDEIRVNISRSGDTSLREEFTITSANNTDLELPLTIVLDQNQSSNFGYISLKENLKYSGNEIITLTVAGSTYPNETKELTLIENQKIKLSISHPSSYKTTPGSTLSFTVRANHSTTANTTINLSSDTSKRLKLPKEITLPAGATEVTFEGTFLDSGHIEKRTKSTVYATATSNHLSASTELELASINIPAFELTLDPATVSEGDGINATFATLKRTTHTDKEVVMALTTDLTNRLILPNTLLFQEGEIQKRFNIGTIDNAIVEGDQTITIFSQVQFEACNCTDATDPTAIDSQKITIIDNDGLALTLKANPSTIKAGAKNNTVTISRNTTNPDILKDAVTVTLSSNLTSILSLPDTVTIPANQMETTVAFDTKIDTTLEGDQNIRIEAKATGYNTGFSWLLITDQNQPDAIITQIALPTQVEAGTQVELTSFITNQGYADFQNGAKLSYYLAPNNSIAGITPFATSLLPSDIPSGSTYTFKETIQFPVLSGALQLIVVVNPDRNINELSFTNNHYHKTVDLLPAYNVSVHLDKQIYKPGEKIQISGTATTAAGMVVPNSDVEITITNTDFSRNYSATTNDQGAFVYSFEPLENEAGSYDVQAAYPGAEVTAQARFDILGFELIGQPRYIKWEPFVNFALGKEFILKNNTSTSLSGISINLPEDVGFALEQTPITLGAGEQAALRFSILATEASMENQYQEIPITITSNEGALLKQLVYYYSKTKQANLVADPISINTTMAKETTRFYEFTIKNIGDVVANEVEVLLPQLAWLNLKSPKIINAIAPASEAKVVLEFTPTQTEQINIPISGTFVLKGKNSNSLTIPFRIETVSDATGTIVVDATDEYTYNTASAPHLAGAKVVIKHPYTGVTVAEGITDQNGLFEIPVINEGYYTVSVSAAKHNPYQNNILVDPGKTTVVNAFMQYQAVTYNWEVVPTEVTDEYDITLIADFETNVPKPVVIMELDNPNLDLESGKSRMVNLSITNHGLIAANRVKIGISDITGYTAKPLIETLDTLHAKTTIVVPILLERFAAKSASKSSNQKASGTCTYGSVTFEAYYPCNQDEKIFSVTPFKGGTRDCGPPPSLNLTIDIGPGYPTFGGNGNGSDPLPRGGTYTPTTFPDFCDPCFRKLFTTVIRCNPITTGGEAIICAIDVGTSTSNEDLVDNIKDCKKKATRKVRCFKDTIETILTCIFGDDDDDDDDDDDSGDKPASKSTTQITTWDYLLEDLEKIDDAQEATIAKIDAYLDNEALRDSDEFVLFFEQVAGNLDSETPFDPNQITLIKKNLATTTLSEAYIDSFMSRWNTTLMAWNQNILTPNAQYPNIIDKTKLAAYQAAIIALNTHTINRGFISASEMYENTYRAIEEFQEEKSKETASVCATVTIEFPQRLTMTREAFEGTLTINNSSSKSIKDIDLNLVVKDEFGEDKSNLFQINKDAFLSGTGIVSPDSAGSGAAIFIPTKAAAPQVAQSYSFGGILSYFDEEQGERVYITLNPVTLEVNPSPDLILDYFLQRDIIADDPLTENILEPSLPAELSLMITNDGFGEAKSVKVESMQPRIVDNEKGLAIDFEMIGSNFNNEPKQLGLLEVDFGTIAPKSSTIGQWYFTSSLIGHFVRYDIEVNHKSSFSNTNLSLIKGAYIHELVKSVKAYQEGNDEISDFLVNDIADSKDTPDRLFFSNGSSEEVVAAESVTYSNVISATNRTTEITINPSTTAWNYGKLEDPGGKFYRLVSIVRNADGQHIPLENFWQTNVTLRDGLNPKYENILHVLDKITDISTYTLSYEAKDTNTVLITHIEGTPEDQSTATPVTEVTVQFNKEIDVNTFTTDNIKLIHQGVTLPKTALLIGKVDATTYSIAFQDLTKTSGYYELSVSSVGIKDLFGNDGTNAKRATWLQFLNELGILRFESDQVKKQPINSVQITFNKAIRSEEFTTDKITINENSVPSSVTISRIDDFNYTISGINATNQENGSYTLAIAVSAITAADGSKGLAPQSFDWIVDNNLPEVSAIITHNQGGLNTQNITELDVLLSREITNTLEASAFTFTKNGQQLVIPVTLQKIDELHYKVSGLGTYTKGNGTYTVRIDQTTLLDENENSGIGEASTTWTVMQTNLEGLTNIKITPDIGISQSDNITSGSAVELVYETLEDDLTVEVYELLATSEVLSYTHLRTTSGSYHVPLTGKVGGKRFKLIAIDPNGNRSAPLIVSAYIDFTDIVTTITPVKESQTSSCYDFDYVDILFEEEIEERSLTPDAITLKSSGLEIPKDRLTITKLTSKKYRISNITFAGDGHITLALDKTKVAKRISGLYGTTTEVKTLGVINKYVPDVLGELEPVIGLEQVYTATPGLKKYDWVISNGEIITSTENAIHVKWNTIGEQSLILRYQTPLDCQETIVTKVIVQEDITLDTPIKAGDTESPVTLAPIPNNGRFSIHTSIPLDTSKIEIFSITGQLVYLEDDVHIDKTAKKITIDQIPSGIYTLVISNQKEKIDIKFVIE